jgi:hypothetical protein
MITAPKPPLRKAAHFFRRFSTSHDDARSNVASAPALAHQSSPVDPATSLACASPVSANLLNRRSRRCCGPSTPLKSP